MNTHAGRSGSNGRRRANGGAYGRTRALAVLDRLLAKGRTRKKLMEALEQEFQANPVRFFRTVVMPLLPRNDSLSFDRPGVVQWRSLLGDTVSDATDRKTEETVAS